MRSSTCRRRRCWRFFASSREIGKRRTGSSRFSPIRCSTSAIPGFGERLRPGRIGRHLRCRRMWQTRFGPPAWPTIAERSPGCRSRATRPARSSRVAPAGQATQAIDFRANRATVTSPELGRYRVVHLATHGLLDTEHPELSGLVLSLVDERGQSQDGFLRLHEIYNLDWSAELVVLSACQTGLGREIRGEGLVGLTRGFMYAGSERVMASLWNVNDNVTAQMMKRFYEGLFARNLSPAAALRAAQVEMWKRPQWRSPYYWAAFVLQGEWR